MLITAVNLLNKNVICMKKVDFQIRIKNGVS